MCTRTRSGGSDGIGCARRVAAISSGGTLLYGQACGARFGANEWRISTSGTRSLSSVHRAWWEKPCCSYCSNHPGRPRPSRERQRLTRAVLWTGGNCLSQAGFLVGTQSRGAMTSFPCGFAWRRSGFCPNTSRCSMRMVRDVWSHCLRPVVSPRAAPPIRRNSPSPSAWRKPRRACRPGRKRVASNG